MRTPAAVMWESYRAQAFDDEVLAPMQEQERSLAFYVGIEGAFIMMEGIADTDLSDKEVRNLVKAFRNAAKLSAQSVNLDRTNGKS